MKTTPRLFPITMIAGMLTFAVSVAMSASAPTAQSDSSTPPAGVSAPDWSGIRAAHAAERHEVRQEAEGALAAHNPGQQWSTRFDGRGFTVTPNSGGWTWGLELRRYGYSGTEHTAGAKAAVSHSQGRVHYDWDATLREWFINDARGLEQGWTFHQRPVGAEVGGPLRVELAVRGGLVPKVSADGISVSYVKESDAAALNFGGLKAWDADGKTLAVRFESVPGSAHLIRVAVEEAGARYPITVDPVAQQATLPAPADGDNFGFAVAVSGNTVVIGAPEDDSNATGVGGNEADNSSPNSGAVYVFVRNGTTATKQAFLKASNTDEADEFGYSVAISGDTVVVGAPGEEGGVYVFTRVGTTWTQQAYLNPAVEGTAFGWSVSIDGDTLVVGAILETDITGNLIGAAYVFTRSGTTWTQQAYLNHAAVGIAPRPMFGWSVAVSGGTVVVGAPFEDETTRNSGAAYVFSRSGTTWTQQAHLKPAAVGTSQDYDIFGYSVAVSGDTVVVGAPLEDSSTTGVNSTPNDSADANDAGAAYVFMRSGTTWTQEAYLKPAAVGTSQAGDHFGWSVAVSGGTVVVGAEGEGSNTTGVNSTPNELAPFSGAAYVFVRSGTTWTQDSYLKHSVVGQYGFGRSVAISGETVVGGWPNIVEVFSEMDTDGDGLLDSWESQGGGIDVNGDGVIDLDLYSLGARPNHKDLFVEVDTERSSLFDEYEAFDAVEAAFANAPVSNPDNVTGINLHIDEAGDADTLLPEETTPIPPAGPYWPAHFASTKASYFGTQQQRSHDNHVHILAAKALAYRYCIIYASLEFAPGGSRFLGIGEIGGNDFLIQVDDSLFYDGKHDALDLAGVLMHELGHTLNLRHGGSDNIHGKPNYPSVMNYANLVPMDHSVSYWRLDYSREPLTGGGGLMLPDLHENALNETTGIPSAFHQNYWMPYGIAGPGGRRLLRMAPLNGHPVDFGEDGVITPGNVTVTDLNHLGEDARIAGMASATPGQLMPAHNDWANLQYKVNPDNTESGAAEYSEGCPSSESIAFLENNVPVVAPTFEAWIAMYGGVGAQTAPDQDADGDGLANFMERFLGTQPTKWSAGLQPTVSGGSGGIRHTRSISPGADVAASYEWSTNLANWHASGATAEGLTVTLIPVKVDANPANDIIEIIPVVTGSTSKLFYRLRVTKTTP